MLRRRGENLVQVIHDKYSLQGSDTEGSKPSFAHVPLCIKKRCHWVEDRFDCMMEDINHSIELLCRAL